MCPAPLASPDENAQIATQLREAAALLQAQEGNPFRVGAYRKAADGSLRTIAPKRFNPSGEAWLPVPHAQRGEWHFTALYSNTARAHPLGSGVRPRALRDRLSRPQEEGPRARAVRAREDSR